MLKLGFLASEAADLQISHHVAAALTAGKVSSLLKSRKLILVLDLDNTLIHASPNMPAYDIFYSNVDHSFASAHQRVNSSSPNFSLVSYIDADNYCIKENTIIPSHGCCAHYLEGDCDPDVTSTIRTLENSLIGISVAFHFGENVWMLYLSSQRKTGDGNELQQILVQGPPRNYPVFAQSEPKVRAISFHSWDHGTCRKRNFSAPSS